MTIASLFIQNFRNIESAALEPSPTGLNLIHGDNGSGKTSILEAIYYLGLGRSFRSSVSTRLIRQASDKFSIVSQIVNDARLIPIGVERQSNGTGRLRVAEQDASSITELAQYLPIRMINSQSHHLFESGPLFRRKYMDWGLFYQSEQFLVVWRHFERALKQRNTILKERRSKQELEIWSDELVKYGLELDQLRRQYIEALTPFFVEITQELLVLADIAAIEIEYQPGWRSDQALATVLQENFLEEYRLGHTQYGPHRADLAVTCNTLPVKHFLSRGQQKLLICAMILAQGKLLSQHTNKRLIYLVDDLPAELDVLSRQKLIALLSQQQTQIFVTAIESATVCSLIEHDANVPVKMFHVEHGVVVPV